MLKGLPMDELEHLYSSLSHDERDELLQCLLIAASRGGNAIVEILEGLMLVNASRELIDGLAECSDGTKDDLEYEVDPPGRDREGH